MQTEAFWNGLFDVRWEDAPLGPEAIRLMLRLRSLGYQERTRHDYGLMVVHLGRMKREALQRCQPPVSGSLRSNSWHLRKDLIQWLHDL